MRRYFVKTYDVPYYPDEIDDVIRKYLPHFFYMYAEKEESEEGDRLSLWLEIWKSEKERDERYGHYPDYRVRIGRAVYHPQFGGWWYYYDSAETVRQRLISMLGKEVEA